MALIGILRIETPNVNVYRRNFPLSKLPRDGTLDFVLRWLLPH